MRIYLDDDIVSMPLLQELQRAHHDVVLPRDVGLSGVHDAIHLKKCIELDRVCLTRNYDDFSALHELVLKSGGHHPGILVVRRDDDPRRNPRSRDIVRAIRNLLAAGAPIADEYTILNHWQ